MIPENATRINNTLPMILVCIVFSILQSACSATTSSPTPNPNIGDGGFLSGETCGPPCFFGIIPGITTEDQTIDILQANGLYQDCQKYDNLSQGGVRGIACDFTLSIGLQDHIDVVENIGFQPSRPITVSDVVAKYGEPNAVLVVSVAPSNKQFTTGMSLCYDSLKVVLGLGNQNSGEFNLMPTTPVVSIGYFDENAYQVNRSYSQKWNGYGVYEENGP